MIGILVGPAAVWSALAGAGVGLGILVCVAGLRGPVPARTTVRARISLLVDRAAVPPRTLLIVVAVAVLTGTATGWVVGGLLAGLAAWALPPVLGRDQGEAARLARIEAVAGWTEMLRDTLSGAAGIEQAILATSDLAPEAIHDEVASLAAAIGAGERLAPALRRFGDDLDDPVADLVVSALVLAVERQARQLGELLGSLARSAREQASMRMRVEAGRARTRTSVRVVVGTTTLFAVVATVINRAYLSAYDGVSGQLVLAVVGGLFCGGFVWLLRISRIDEPDRVLRTAATHDAPAVSR